MSTWERSSGSPSALPEVLSHDGKAHQPSAPSASIRTSRSEDHAHSWLVGASRIHQRPSRDCADTPSSSRTVLVSEARHFRRGRRRPAPRGRADRRVVPRVLGHQRHRRSRADPSLCRHAACRTFGTEECWNASRAVARTCSVRSVRNAPLALAGSRVPALTPPAIIGRRARGITPDMEWATPTSRRRLSNGHGYRPHGDRKGSSSVASRIVTGCSSVAGARSAMPHPRSVGRRGRRRTRLPAFESSACRCRR